MKWRITENSTNLFFDASGNVIEQRVSLPLLQQFTIQYVWSAAGGNHLVLRDWDTDGNALTSYPGLPAGMDQRLYALPDAQGNISAIAGVDGTVVERYFYSPEGKGLILSGDGQYLRPASSYNWQYTYRGGRQDAPGRYWTGRQVVDYLTGGPLKYDPMPSGAAAAHNRLIGVAAIRSSPSPRATPPLMPHGLVV